MRLIEKAYCVYTDHPYNGEVVYAESPGQARSKGRYMDDFVNIKVKRVKEEDKVEFEGKIYTREYARLLAKQVERLEKMKGLPEDEVYLVQDNRSYVGNSVLWWALNGNGYTTDIDRAQTYTKSEIVEQFGKARETDVIWPANHVYKAVKSHVDRQGLDSDFSV